MSTNEEIVSLLQAGQGDRNDLIMELWTNNRGFIIRKVRQYSSQEADDLEQEAFLAMLEAVSHWREDAGSGFLSYMDLWIRAKFDRYFKNESVISSSMYNAVMRYRKVISEFEREEAREPSEEEICSLMNITGKELYAVRDASRKSKSLSLDSPIETQEGETYTLGDLTPSPVNPEEDVLDKVEQEELKAVIWPLVDGLPGDQPEVIRKRYQEGKTLKEIGEETGSTFSQVRDTEKKGLKELRKSKRSNLLRPFLEDDRIRDKALHGNGVKGFQESWTSSTERIGIELAEKKD